MRQSSHPSPSLSPTCSFTVAPDEGQPRLKSRASGRGQKGPTVGRRCDLPWVVMTTYRRFFRRPTVGRFWGVPLPLIPSGYSPRGLSLVMEGAFALGSEAPSPRFY